MIWVALILLGWLCWVLVEPMVHIQRGIGRCRARTAGVDELGDTIYYRCKFNVGHNGKHRAEDGPMW